MSKIIKNKFKFIYVEITNSCNLSCYFCPSASLENNQFISVEQFKHIILEISNYTNTIYLHILGEPLLHPMFKTLIEICNKFCIDVRLTTNATLIANYDFAKLNLKKINISLQSLINFDEEYLKSYFRAIDTMLHQVRPKLINKELGIDFRIWNDKSNQQVCKLNALIKSYLFDKIKITDYPNVRLSEEEEFSWPSDEDPKHQFEKCLGGKTHIGILVNGDVVLCCLDYQGKTKIGNIYEESLNNIICGDIYQNAMLKSTSGKAYFPLCESCKYRNRFSRK